MTTSVTIHDTSKRTNFGIRSAPVKISSVLPWPQKVLPSLIAGHLIKNPTALQHIEGVDFIEVEAILKRETIICDLGHLSSGVISFIDPHSVGARVLRWQTEKQKYMNTNREKLKFYSCTSLGTPAQKFSEFKFASRTAMLQSLKAFCGPDHPL